jgi:hypothetical protein
LPIKLALRKIDLLSAVAAFVGFIELIREDLFLSTTIGASADKRLQVLEVFKARAMLWCGHERLLVLMSTVPAWRWMPTPAGHN